MATTYTLAGNATLRDIGNAAIFGVTTARTGGDVYNLNGKTLTIDEDTRYGKSGLSSGVTGNFHLGNITSSTTLGGNLNIDARYVRMIPFAGGSGAVAAGESIAWEGATAKVIGVYSAINVAPALTGVTTGWLKVTEWNEVAFPTSGSYSTPNGWSCTIAGADVAGFIEVVGLEGSTATIPRLGALNITGAWFAVGTTTGSNTDTYQLPTNGSTACYFAGVFVSKTSTPTQDSDYELYPCVGSLTGANLIGTDAVRGKVCWINQSGVLRFGSDGTNSIGYVPPAGRKIVLPNILLVNSSTATGAANAVPNTSLGTRYDFTTTNGGVISIDKALMAWYPSFSRASAVTMSNVAINEQLYLYGIGAAVTLTNTGVGITAAQSQIALNVQGCFGGMTLTDCTWPVRGANYAVQIQDCSGVQITRDKAGYLSGWVAGDYTYSLNRVVGFVSDDATIGTAPVVVVYSRSVRFNRVTYFGRIGSGSTLGSRPFETGSGCSDILFDGLTQPDSDGFPANGVLSVGSYGSDGVEVRNVGSESNPFSMGSTASYLVNNFGVFNKNVKARRCWLSNTTTGIVTTGDSTNAGCYLDNVYIVSGSGYVYGLNAQRSRLRGVRATPPNTVNYALAYGTLWNDYFTSDTQGLFRLEMNEPDAETGSYVTLSGASFSGQGKLVFSSIGSFAVWEMDYFALGVTGFQNVAPILESGTIGNFTAQYQIDKNDDSGWSDWATLTAANLSAETGIDYTKGLKLRVKLTANSSGLSSGNALIIYTTTGATEQQTLYPLESYTLTLTGLASGSDVVVRAAGTSTVLGSVDSISGSTWSYVYQSVQAVDIDVIKPGMVIVPFRNLALTTADSSLPVSQLADRNYL